MKHRLVLCIFLLLFPVASFAEEYTSVEAPKFQISTLEVKVGTQELSVKEVLKEIFSAPTFH